MKRPDRRREPRRAVAPGMRSAALALGLLAAAPPAIAGAPPVPWGRPAALIRVDGRVAEADRVLLLPVRPVAGIRLATRRLRREAPGVARRWLDAFLVRAPGRPVAGPDPSAAAVAAAAPPPVAPVDGGSLAAQADDGSAAREEALGGIAAAAALFGDGAGVFRLGGTLAGDGPDRFWRQRGVELTPAAGGGTWLASPELWGFRIRRVLHGGWGPRPGEAWLGGLDGRGRRLYRLRRPPAGELVHVWARGERPLAARLRAWVPLPSAPAPCGVAELEVALSAPADPGRPVTWRVRLKPAVPGCVRELADWLQAFWIPEVDARIRPRRDAVVASWDAPRDHSRWRARLAALERIYLGWMAGEPYRALL